MKTTSFLLVFLFSITLLPSIAPARDQFSGYVELESRFFFNDSTFNEQKEHNGSLAFEPEYYHEWEDGSSFIFRPFGRLDYADSERSHFDVRELNYLWLTDEWELRVGVGKVFWGVTEFVHLVDIINQTDLVEDIDEEDKLGQPMVKLSLAREWGLVDMFVLPWFRERTFPGKEGRLRTEPEVDVDHARYESGAEEHHVDFAARYSNTIGDLDFGIYHFIGTGREPTLLGELDKYGRPTLIPYYEQINQTGLDVQLVTGEWLWKLEALYRRGQQENFYAGVGGFEYTFVGLAETGMDLGVIGEYAYDTRCDDATTVFQNDAMFGLRLTPNDAAGTEMLFGFMQDVKQSSNAMRLEASRRIGDNWRISLEAWGFLDAAEEDPLVAFKHDDFIRLQLAYYF
jgi:hypothetical protein